MIRIKNYGDREMLASSPCGRCGCPCPCTCYIPPQPAAAYLGNYMRNTAITAMTMSVFMDIQQG